MVPVQIMITRLSITLLLIHSYGSEPIGRTSSLQNHQTQSKPSQYGSSGVSVFAIVGFIFGFVIVFTVVYCLCYCCNYTSDNSLNENSKYTVLDGKSYRTNEGRLLWGPSGLKNTNETCYMNSMIQAVASSDILIKEYEQLAEICDKTRECPKLKMFVKLLNNINTNGGGRPVMLANTETLKVLMQSVNWKLESQQDSFHLLSAVINAIQKEIKDILEKENITMPPKYKMLHAFSEDPSHNKLQDHLALALPLCGDFRKSPGVDLKFLLEEFFKSSKIEDSSNETRIFFYKEAPKVLIIHVQANEWSAQHNAYVKPTYFIRYSERMKHVFHVQQTLNCCEPDIVEVEYTLLAVVHHMGGVSGGHYITYRKYKNEWYLTNDEQVERSVFLCDVIPYIMVYEKREL